MEWRLLSLQIVFLHLYFIHFLLIFLTLKLFAHIHLLSLSIYLSLYLSLIISLFHPLFLFLSDTCTQEVHINTGCLYKGHDLVLKFIKVYVSKLNTHKSCLKIINFAENFLIFKMPLTLKILNLDSCIKYIIMVYCLPVSTFKKSRYST